MKQSTFYKWWEHNKILKSALCSLERVGPCLCRFKKNLSNTKSLTPPVAEVVNGSSKTVSHWMSWASQSFFLAAMCVSQSWFFLQSFLAVSMCLLASMQAQVNQTNSFQLLSSDSSGCIKLNILWFLLTGVGTQANRRGFPRLFGFSQILWLNNRNTGNVHYLF